jgi:UDP-GlcNAc:undecaprenyl-phosphate GlcNAc-1-phosphate transferase
VPLPLRYSLAFGLPLLITVWATPVAARLARRAGLIDQPKDGRFNGLPIPFLGGVAVAVGLLVMGLAMSGWEREILVILACGVGLGVVGLVDDWRGVGPLAKIGFEVLAALALWFANVRAGLFGDYLLDLGLTIVWVVLVTNAINLLDNMDGLSSGVVAIAALTFFTIAASQGDFLVGSFALVIAGASLGFLRHNFPPASIFLGDAGSLMLGFLLSALALKLDLVGESGVVRSAVAALVLGVPIFDTVLVVVARLREHRPVYLGGTDHSSHRLAHRGLSTRTVAALTYSVQACCCAIALTLVDARGRVLVPAVIGVAAAATLGLWSMLALPHPDGPSGNHAQESAPAWAHHDQASRIGQLDARSPD